MDKARARGWPIKLLGVTALALGAIIGVGGVTLGLDPQRLTNIGRTGADLLAVGLIAGVSAAGLWWLAMTPSRGRRIDPADKRLPWLVFWGTFWGMILWLLAALGIGGWIVATRSETIMEGTNHLLGCFLVACPAVGMVMGTLGGLAMVAVVKLTGGVPVESVEATNPLRPHRRWIVRACAMALVFALGLGAFFSIPTKTWERAIQDGDIEQVRKHMFWGCDVSAVDAVSMTPLAMAAQSGQWELAGFILEHGAQVNPAPPAVPPLGAAVCCERSSRQRGMIDFLLARGAKFNAPAGRAVLCRAADDPELLETILERGAGTSAAGPAGLTALDYCAFNGYTESAEILLKAGAGVDHRSSFGSTPLMSAATGDREDVARLLIAWGADVSARDDRGQSPLHLAAGQGHEGTVALLLDADASVNAAENNGYTPLDWAEAHRERVVAEVAEAEKELGLALDADKESFAAQAESARERLRKAERTIAMLQKRGAKRKQPATTQSAPPG
ncbi:MAG TPA: ankyrin repeat domain-containing protein [Phycisphaerae bacterium]|nr:ankyrin repeat domain-containing protein [Phycisphaerae bacterium]